VNRPWWAPVLQWTAWGILMAVVMAWIARSRLRSRTASQARLLVHPPSTLVVGLVGFALFAGSAVVSNVYANKTTTVLTTAVFLGFAALSLLVVADYFLAKHEVTNEGINYRRLTGRRGSLKWAEVATVHYAPSMKWFRLATRSGEVARVSAMLVGLPEFAQLVLRQVPPSAIEPDTLPVLQATADGHPPSVWGY
jgi:hypothetical protein